MSAPHIPVVAAVIVESGRVLLCQRRDGEHLPLLWEFPGGKIDPGERPAEALERELREEIGVASQIGAQLAEVWHRYPEKRVWLRFFAAAISGNPVAHVHRRLAWVELEHLHDYAVPPPNALVVRRLLAGELVLH